MQSWNGYLLVYVIKYNDIFYCSYRIFCYLKLRGGIEMKKHLNGICKLRLHFNFCSFSLLQYAYLVINLNYASETLCIKERPDEFQSYLS